MRGQNAYVRDSRRLLAFFGFTFALSWVCFYVGGPALAASALTPLGILRRVVFMIGVFAPAIVALALMAYFEGRAGVERLLAGIFRWQVGLRWYVFAVTYFAIIKLTAALIYRLQTGTWPAFGAEPWYLMIAAISVSTWVQAGEELGWRAFALPRMAEGFGLGPASVLLGVIWASWHFPLFLLPATTTTGQSFPLYLLQVTAISVTMAWLYWRTRCSLLLVMMLHAAVNNTKDIVPSAVPGATNVFALSTSRIAWLTVMLLWIAAAYFLFAMRGATLTSQPS